MKIEWIYLRSLETVTTISEPIVLIKSNILKINLHIQLLFPIDIYSNAVNIDVIILIIIELPHNESNALKYIEGFKDPEDMLVPYD